MLGAGIDPCWERTACRLVALLEETQKEQERMRAEKAEQKRLAEEAKLQAGRRGHRDSNSPLKSALARKQSASQS